MIMNNTDSHLTHDKTLEKWLGPEKKLYYYGIKSKQINFIYICVHMNYRTMA